MKAVGDCIAKPKIKINFNCMANKVGNLSVSIKRWFGSPSQSHSNHTTSVWIILPNYAPTWHYSVGTEGPYTLQ
jgi:hypothetical protein